MATWEDGPEYAPVERPAGFDSPEVAPLDIAPPRPDPSAGAPLVAPEFHQEQVLAPLSAYAPDPGEERDPHAAFAVVTSTMTGPGPAAAPGQPGAWGAVAHHHSAAQADWAPPTGAPVVAVDSAPVPRPDAVVGPPPVDPTSPITLTQGRRSPDAGSPGFPAPQFPPPGLPAADAPGGAGPWQSGPGAPAPPVRFTAGGWLAAMRPATVALLVLGGVFAVISPLCFAGAAWSAWQVRQRSDWVRNAVMVGAGVLGVTALLGLVMTGGAVADAWNLLGQVSLVVCWLLLAAVAAIVGTSLARGERPETWG